MNEEILFTLIVCTAASFAGAFIQRVSGFGYGIFVMMFFPLVLAYGQATALSGCISLISASYVAFNLRKNIQWKQVFLPLIAYVLTNYFSVRFVGDADTGLLTRLLGGALLLLSVYFFFFSKKIRIKATPVAALAAGGLSGVMSGLFSMGGPPMVIYYLSGAESNDAYLATIQCYFALSNVVATATRAANGLVTVQVLWLIIPAGIAALLANLVGKKVYGRLSPDLLKKVVYAFMAVSGAISLIRG